jgi:hypothetical protein
VANPPHFVLYGGAALALTLKHRQTEDFDFFSSSPFNPDTLSASLPFVAKILESGKNTLVVKTKNGTRISYFGGLPLAQVKTPSVHGCVPIASPEDILATKLKVILERDEPRDYIDIYQLVKSGLTIELGLAACKAVYGKDFNLHLPIKALTYYDTPELQPLPEEIKKFLTEKAIHLGPIPEIAPACAKITVSST